MAKGATDKTYKLGPFRITRTNSLRLVAADFLVLLMMLIPAPAAFAAEMLRGGNLDGSNFSNFWNAVIKGVGVGCTVVLLAAGAGRGSTYVDKGRSYSKDQMANIEVPADIDLPAEEPVLA